MIGNVKWEDLIFRACDTAETLFEIALEIDTDIVQELSEEIKRTIEQIGLNRPNVAKIAGHIVFWIRKLKPIHHSAQSENKYLAINEWVAVVVGIAVCRIYFDDNCIDQDNATKTVKTHSRLFNDFVGSLRVHSHSPSSSTITFESLFTER